jgi:MerR family transcriptional regulator, repressor of the yfmOP operon
VTSAASATTDTGATPDTGAPAPERLLRIQEAAAETGLTARSIRYYEELGLLSPAARSDGAYRLYDQDDLERLRFIRGLRDDAGFSLAEIGQLLGDEQARVRNRAEFQAAQTNEQRRPIVIDALERVDRQVTTLEAKIQRLEAMIADARARRAHLQAHLEDIEADREPTHHHADGATATGGPR